MSDKWTHVICEACWTDRNPGRTPHRVTYPTKPTSCCFCSKTCNGDIFVREDPADTPCRGDHK